ncbi:MAG: hypothetical protein CMO44_12985 [Verrucomicrobiales bacterium]|nr:hypothetical protein [Verrucomicrobiales bacterium]|tara:strand:+ start:23037 stop:23465 length:429 start_codon:yes stop_codon:yes gene_type:complete
MGQNDLENNLQKLEFASIFASFIILIAIAGINILADFDTISVSENINGIASGDCVNAIHISNDNYYVYSLCKTSLYYLISILLLIWYIESEKSNAKDFMVLVSGLLLFLLSTNDAIRTIMDYQKPFIVKPGKGSLRIGNFRF